MHIGKVKAYLCQKQPPATTPNVKAEMVLFLSTPEIRMSVHSLLPRGVCGPVCKLTVWAVWPCPLTIPSPGRKIWVHHHWCIGAAPSHKGGVLLLRLLFQACYLDHFFCCMLFCKGSIHPPCSRKYLCLVYPSFPQHLRSSYCGTLSTQKCSLPGESELAGLLIHNLCSQCPVLLFTYTLMFAVTGEAGFCCWC